MQTMSFKWCSKGCFIEAIEVFLNPYFYLINNKSPNYSGWETHKIQYGLKIIYVTLRAKEVDYDKEMIKTFNNLGMLTSS